MMMNIKRYSDLVLLNSFEERFDYLQLNGSVGFDTFGYDRFINQEFYRSKIWEEAKRPVILRDHGCDLGIPGYEILGRIYVHHINPIGVRDIQDFTEYLVDPEYLITTSLKTHNLLHYGNKSGLITVVERTPNDTCPWKNH